MNGQILTLKEVAANLKLVEKMVYKLTTESKLPEFKLGAGASSAKTLSIR